MVGTRKVSCCFHLLLQASNGILARAWEKQVKANQKHVAANQKQRNALTIPRSVSQALFQQDNHPEHT